MVARLAYFRSEEALGAEAPYDRFEGTATVALPLERNVGYLRVSGGSSFDTELPLYDTFSLGGPVSLPGLAIGELRGTGYWSAQASYLWRIADISYIFGQSIFAGLKFTAADMSGRIDGVSASPIYSGAFVLAGRTPLGPLSLSLAGTTTQRLAAGARAGTADRGRQYQRLRLVIARPRLASIGRYRPPKRYIAPTLTLNTSPS